MGALAFFSSHWRVLALIGACLAAIGLYQLGKRDGYQDAISDQLQSTIKAERERAADDAKLRDLSDYDFCRLALKRRGLSVEQCDELRGLPSE
ncbi:hypothetical protein KUG47_12210 [Falsochrobactrum sp. TDYN1]|uniref:Uncharacterized protein n=1 Tax=Falsochrobactrum tianjinense TaxID=2706015 RepID=A0A949PP57_9HYPH|nr:hypothetical protein [Falsochrobactrum sp. TDYN1]MBV2144257.1 hypothetical protein [Falsochrobactrum sp. TDYN1]